MIEIKKKASGLSLDLKGESGSLGRLVIGEHDISDVCMGGTLTFAAAERTTLSLDFRPDAVRVVADEVDVQDAAEEGAT